MVWQLCIAGYLILSAAVYVLQRYLGKTLQEHKRLVGWLYLACLYPLSTAFALCNHPHFDIGWYSLVWLAAGSALFPIITILTLKASKQVDASRFTILSNLTPVVTIAAATLLLHENLDGRQLFGAAIIVTAAFIITLPQLAHRGRAKTTGILIALVVFTLSGLATVFERYMLNRMDYATYLIYGWGFQGLWMTVVAWPERKSWRIAFTGRRNAWALWVYAVAGTVKGILFVVALKLIGNASLFGALISFTTILVVPAAYIMLKEKDWLWLKIAAAVTGTAGLIIINTR